MIEIHDKDIRLTKPNVDCVYCELHHFVDFITKKHVEEMYAVCTNKVKSQGMVSIDITQDGNPLQWETTCKNCKLYCNKNQLDLF